MSGPKLSTVIVKLASRCNLNCRYCYLYNHQDKTYLQRPALMRDEVFDAVLSAMARHCDRQAPHSMSILLHGGEPLLIGRERFVQMVNRARSVLRDKLRRISVQTNGVLIDDEWACTLAHLQIEVSVSLDGPKSTHDDQRIDHRGIGSYEQVIRGIDALLAAGVHPYVLCVINPRCSGVETYRHLLSLGFKRFDFLLPDVTHDSKPLFYGDLSSGCIARYLVPIFDEWLETDDPSIEIRIFHTLLTRIMGGRASHDAFGNARLSYIAVETDGTMESLDVLRVCETGLSSTGLNVCEHDFEDLAQGSQRIYEAMCFGFPAASVCRACAEFGTCGGGYPPHRYSQTAQFDNPSVWCADIKALLSHMRGAISARGFAC